MSRKGIRALAALAALGLAAASAPAEPVLTMDEVVVTATRTATPVTMVRTAASCAGS